MLKISSNKSCLELNFVQKRQWANLQRNLFHKAGYILIMKYVKMIVKCKKTKSVQLGILSHSFGVSRLFFRFSYFAAFRAKEKSKDFLVYFFAALIKHKIHMKYEKCIVSVSYFVVCFIKTFAKYPQNAKYKKCIAGLTGKVKYCP